MKYDVLSITLTSSVADAAFLAPSGSAVCSCLAQQHASHPLRHARNTATATSTNREPSMIQPPPVGLPLQKKSPEQLLPMAAAGGGGL